MTGLPRSRWCTGGDCLSRPDQTKLLPVRLACGNCVTRLATRLETAPPSYDCGQKLTGQTGSTCRELMINARSTRQTALHFATKKLSKRVSSKGNRHVYLAVCSPHSHKNVPFRDKKVRKVMSSCVSDLLQTNHLGTRKRSNGTRLNGTKKRHQK